MSTAAHRRAAMALAGLTALAMVVWTVQIDVPLGAKAFFDNQVYNGVIAGAALLVLWRAVAVRENRVAWLLVAAGMGSWLAGDIWWVIHAEDDVVPIPSLADVYFFALYPPMAIAIVMLIRRRVGKLSSMLALDGVIGACAIAGLCAAFVLEPVLDTASGSLTAMAVTIAYPVLDIVLVALLVEAVALGGWVLSRSWALLTAGLLVFGLTDAIYYAQVAAGTYVDSGYLDVGWLLGMFLVGIAAWQPEPKIARAADHGWRQLIAPGVFAAIALGVAFYAYTAQINVVAMGLACAALLAVILRMVMTFRENLRILEVVRHESVTDALTGLGNRRRLLNDLEARLQDDRPCTLVLCDLNGFKRYNDTFGHPAGDALLNRLGGRLASAVTGDGQAYRMGGDEFCALLDLAADNAAVLVQAALAERGEGFAVDASCGTVVLPLQADTAAEALRLADARMYEQKRGGRPTAEAQSVELLMRLLSERDPALSEHVAGVAELAVGVAERLGLGAGQCEDVRVAAALHDVGKLAIPDSILNKPGPLDSDEWSFMCRHTLIGERILESTPGLAGVAALVRASHERPDGCGYPDALAGEDIPFGARIVAVCDAYDAMVSDRPYRRGMPPADALAELRAGAGTQFDAAVVDAFVAVHGVWALPSAA
jgi:two-component system, cell cycle response regulator